MAAFALIHSLLVGPSTWKLVAAQLQQYRYQVIAPTLVDSESDTRAYWEQHAESAARAVNAAEPIANPFPIAAVVFPRESNPSVIFRTSGPRPDISEIPPALSAIGQ